LIACVTPETRCDSNRGEQRQVPPGVMPGQRSVKLGRTNLDGSAGPRASGASAIRFVVKCPRSGANWCACTCVPRDAEDRPCAQCPRVACAYP